VVTHPQISPAVKGLCGAAPGTLWVYGLEAQFIRSDADHIMSSTVAQVQQTSSRYLAPDQMTVVAVGEDKVVHEQFAPFDLPVVDVPKP
jgi:hypothetical protein